MAHHPSACAIAGGIGVAAFLRQPFLAASWYDVFPSLAVCEAGGAVAGCGAREFSRRVADAQAARDISGLYRFLLKLVSPDGILERLPRVAKQYFDFVDVTVKKLGPGAYESHITGIPAVLVEQYRDVTGAFLDRALRGAGACDLTQSWLPAEPAGTRDGVEIVSLGRTLRWTV